jgi:hypothetical protein
MSVKIVVLHGPQLIQIRNDQIVRIAHFDNPALRKICKADARYFQYSFFGSPVAVKNAPGFTVSQCPFVRIGNLAE